MSAPRRWMRSIAQLLGLERDRSREPLFGLTPDQLRALADLRQSNAWALYVSLLDTAVTLYADGLLGARDDAALHELRGMILGLRKAATIVDETLRHEEDLARAEHHRTERERAEHDGRVISLYGSPAWGRTRGE